MKNLLSLVSILLFGFAGFAQDYQCIRDNATYLYSDGTRIKAINIDSVVSTPQGLEYYNYPCISNPSPDCYSMNGPSWIGRKVLVKLDGDNVFTNKNNQSVIIKTLKNLGDFWTCYQFDDGNYINATITETQEMEFLGLTDSVKKVTFQAYYLGGSTLSHSINGRFLLLSKNYGMVRAMNFKLFPDLPENLFDDEGFSEYMIKGISNPTVGSQNLVLSQVWDFSIGDEIDTYRRYNCIGYDGYYYEDKYKHHILEKEFSGNTFNYLVYKCGWQYAHVPGGGHTYFHDSITESYTINPTLAFVNSLPDQFIITYDYGNVREYAAILSSFYQSSNKQMKSVWYEFYSDYPHDCIYVLWSKNEKDLGDRKEYYIENLGDYFYQFYPYSSEEWSNPVYFKSGTAEWGNPYSFNCEDFVTSENEMTTSQKDVLILPNPMRNWTKLTIDNPENKEYQFQLFNSMGVLLREYHFQTNELIIPRENLGNGIYFYLLSDGQKVTRSGKLIIR